MHIYLQTYQQTNFDNSITYTYVMYVEPIFERI